MNPSAAGADAGLARSPVFWGFVAAALIAALGSFRSPTDPALAEALLLASGVLGAVVGGLCLTAPVPPAYRLLGAMSVAVGAAGVTAASGLTGPATDLALLLGGQATAAVALAVAMQWFERDSVPWIGALAAALVASAGLGTLATALPESAAAWAHLAPGAAFFVLLLRTLHRGHGRGADPETWLAIVALAGLAQAVLRVLPVAPETPAAALIGGPVALLLAVWTSHQQRLREAERERAEFRDANRTLILASELGRRLHHRNEAVRRLREAVQLMRKEEDISAVLTALRQSLESLQVPIHRCGINVIEERAEGMFVRSHTLGPEDRWQVSPTRGEATVVRCWKQGQVYYRPDLHDDDPWGERQLLEGIFGESVRSVVDAPFSHGTLAVNSLEPAVFDDDSLADLKGLAEVLSEGFRRFDDIRSHRALEERMESFFSLSLELLCISGFDGYFKLVNPAWTTTLGYSREELLASPMQRFIHPEDLRGTLTQVARLRRGERAVSFENRFICRDGSYRWLQWSAVRERDGDLVFGAAHDVTERLQAERKLGAARDRAEAANLAKSQFLANMSHELRTPLNAIIGYSEMLLEEAVDGDETTDLERIHGSGKHLLSLINDILDLSKIEAGRAEVLVEEFPVGDLLTQAMDVSRPLIERNGNRLHIDYERAPARLQTDQVKVRQNLLNLLSNAAKFTEQGDVTLRVESEARGGTEGVLFTVADTGCGMTVEQQAHIFEPFRQADASTTRRHGGTGLGLAITKRFCQLLGGDIDVDSEPDRGTTFRMWLPVEAPQVRAGEPPATAPAGTVDRSLPDRIRAMTGDAQPTVMVVDDDEATRELMVWNLRRTGFEVVTASTGEEALRLVRQRRPQAITLDVVMPGMDGWKVLEALKDDDELADIPVILLSMLDDRSRGFALGAQHYLTKPVERDRLVRILRSVTHPVARRVLVVDDDLTNRALMEMGLKREGWSVAVAGNGIEALARIEQEPVDLILLDLMMPEMDGFEFLDRLRGDPRWATMPVVIVSAHRLDEGERARLQGRVEQVLSKQSVELDDLLNNVSDLVKSAVQATDGEGT